MESFKAYGGHVHFYPSGDVAFPCRCHWTASNHAGQIADGQTGEDAWAKLEPLVRNSVAVEEMEPERL